MAPGLPGVRAMVVGASTGGIEALSQLLPALPPSFPAAVTIVQHLPRARPSLLVEIFSRKCALPLCEPFDKQPIDPGQVYFAPADYHLLVERGPRFSLSIEAPVNHSRPAIDVLFESAAEVYQQQLMGVVLTGANADGAAGLDAVRRHGGLTVVQDPASAQYPTMPRAALALGAPHFVVSLEALCALLQLVGEGRAVHEKKIVSESE